MKRKLLFLILLISPFLSHAQKTVHVSLDWKGMFSQQSFSGTDIKYMSFTDATYLPDFGSIPIYSTEIQLPDELFSCDAVIKVLKSDTIMSFEISDFELLTDSIFYQFTYQNKNAGFFLVPLYRIGQSDQFVRITEFEFSVVFLPKEESMQISRAANNKYAEQSVLSTGKWIKLGVMETGVYKIGYDDIIQMGINPEQIDPETIGIFGNYSGMLPEDNSKHRFDDLQENAIMKVGTEDGQFNQGDYFLFYGRSAVKWRYNVFTGRFDHFNNIYSDTTFYFFTPDQGSNKTVENIQSTSLEPTQQLSTFSDYAVHESDNENLLHSGKEWFGERFTGDTLERTFSFYFPNLDQTESLYLNCDIVGRGLINTYFEVYANDELIVDSAKIQKLSVSSAYYANRTNRKVTFFVDDDRLDIKVKYITSDPTTIAWLNYLELNVKRKLIFSGGQLKFREPHITASGNITQFNLESNDQNVQIWEITDLHFPKKINFQLNDGLIQFRLPTDSLMEFIVFDDQSYLKPVSYSQVKNQNLHGIDQVDLIIVAAPDFISQARRLAGIHESVDGMKVIIVTPQEVFNEFSSGSQDAAAIRDMMKMLKSNGAFGNNHAYLLLFGDASFDYKNRVLHNTNFVLTYQSDESLRETGSFVTDDFMGLLDDGEGANSTGDLDVGIGRLPVSSEEQANDAVDKIEHYLRPNRENRGGWQNTICFVADDMDKNLHLDQANSMIEIADTLNDGIYINKIFSDAFKKVTIPGGSRFPEVNEKIRKQVDDGALILNYTGHGGLIGWSEEVILDVPTIKAFENINNMPLFITATCEFSRFDNPRFVSAGEYLFLNKNGGGIALLTTTRLAYAHANIVVNRRIYENLMKTDKGEEPRLGDLVRMSKIPSNNNYLNFVLLGDPAMKLAFPENEVLTELINDQSPEASLDTIQALSEVSVSGIIADADGQIMNNFNGYLYPKVYDKPSKYRTLGNDINSFKVDFYLSDRILFDGKVSVSNGKFSFSFLVPRDISYDYGFGEIKYYALDTVNYSDAWGGYEKILIGGINQNAENDNSGPEIRMYLNSKDFQNGQTTTGHPLLLAYISDDLGINSTGQSLGRDIVLTLDNNPATSWVLNEYFQISPDTYKKGSLEYQLENLTKGWHELSLKAWDLQNNSSESTLSFYVDDEADILLEQVVNYPNPFVHETNFGFIHNKNGSNFSIEILIYDINGRFIESLKTTSGSDGNKITPLVWNGCNQNGSKVKPGVYSYQIIVTDFNGNQTIQQQKMIKLSE